MPQIYTTKGFLEESSLTRTVGFEDRENEMVVWVEWRLIPDGDRLNVVGVGQGELVRRDAHVIMKRPSVVADAIATSLG